MNHRRFFAKGIRPTITIFILSYTSAYIQGTNKSVTEHLLVAISCGIFLAIIYALWDFYKKRRKNSLKSKN